MIGTQQQTIFGPIVCVECGYDLAGHIGAETSAFCPECGKPVRESDPVAVHNDFVRSYLPTFRGGVRMLLVTHVAASMLFVCALFVASQTDGDWSFMLVLITMSAIASVIATRKIVRSHPLLNRSASIRWFARAGRTISVAPLAGVAMVIVSVFVGPPVSRLYAACALLLSWLPCATMTFMHIAAVCRCRGRRKLAAASDLAGWWLLLTLTIPVISVLWSALTHGGPPRQGSPIAVALFILFFPGYWLALIVLGSAVRIELERRNFFRPVP